MTYQMLAAPADVAMLVDIRCAMTATDRASKMQATVNCAWSRYAIFDGS
jgi:hypothetical protein